ncbi:DUF2917 domain-containing protein [Ideonella sp. A 288]|uniref:DUF2917 domain-containing protein n=1 Tax=Ideonella sp. A 288 TaxID=1962181 RepID=UPI000B4B799A|nr:DUF2917 domain-containing protein [Ideonella sp. A 288]
MDASQHPLLTLLPKDAVRRLRGERGRGIAVFRGQVWLTQDGDLRDIVLDAGESFDFDRPGHVVVQALGDASLLLYEAESVLGRAQRAAHGLVQRLLPSDRDRHHLAA